MKFSIIIPAYNAENHIRKALDSIKSQTFTDYELIVVCDSCTDRTVEIAKEYTDKVEIVDYHQDGFTRNKGIDVAQGDWLLFMDDDDWWLHEYVLEQLNQKLTENPNIDILCFSFIFKGWKYASPRGNNGCRWLATWNKCWRREFVGNARFSNVYSKSDVDFDRRVFARRPKVLDWDMPMYYYNYLREGSISEQAKKGKRV